MISADLSSVLDFYRGRRVLVTGHTGFKGSWLCEILLETGASVKGYALESPTDPSLFDILGLSERVDSEIADIRDFKKLSAVFAQFEPEIVFHLAAQPLVRESYRDPVGTYETNVMGTVNVCECVRQSGSVRSFLNVTTDKVYRNNEWLWGYRENEMLDGFDPYSNSKSCSELVTHSYIRSFFKEQGLPVSTARAGNVIGGGDFAAERIVPDCVRAALAGEKIIVRNPNSVRPYQHVLEPLFAYLMIAAAQCRDPAKAGSYNVGPDETDCVETRDLADWFCQSWGEGLSWAAQGDGGPHEANFLKLDCSRLKSVFGWHPAWNAREAIEKTVEWSRAYREGKKPAQECLKKQIREFMAAYAKRQHPERQPQNLGSLSAV